MATQQVLLTTTVVATGTLQQQRLVGYDGAPCAKGALAFGIAEVDAVAGDATPVNVAGILAAVAGEAITAGEALQAGDDGTVIPLEATGTPVRVGVAVTAATAAGDTLKVMWRA
ncbi:TPA: DUF2190 family protein [Klebsiella oxytoca]|uniref:DUF2190 family protein n=1 Tax=Klebsiella oxytoca TaxID=571 RepID=A0AAN5RG62_KLEOX|nr:DUF2190 family protein [Klebsiella oxytoca]